MHIHPDDVALNEYVDRTLGPDERRSVEQHIDVCAACRTLVDDVAGLKRAAAALDAIDPPASAWSRIERAIQSDRSPHLPEHGSGGRWWMWTAAAVLVAAAGVGLRFGLPSVSEPAVPAVGNPPTEVTAAAVESELRQAQVHYENAIRGLEQIATAEKDNLDPTTVATLQKNLQVIDQAITESRAAVRAQPDSEPALVSLLESFKAKLALLQDAVALINEARKGNEKG